MYSLRLGQTPGARTSVTSYSWAWVGPHQRETWFWTGSRTRSPSPRSCTEIQYFPGLSDPILSLLLSATQEIPVRPLLRSERQEKAARIYSQSAPAANCKRYPQN